MQIQSIQSVPLQQGASAPQGAAFAPGDLLQAEVVQADQGQVVLRLPQGDLLQAKSSTMDPLQPGDMVLLQVAGSAGNAPKLELISVNGQPVKDGAAPAEYALLRMQVAPNRANLAIAEALSQMGAPARPETFSRMADLSVRYPALEAGPALLLAASSLPLDGATVEAFTQWLQNPLHTTDLTAAAEGLAARDSQAVPLLEAALAQMEAAVAQSRALPAAQAAPQEAPALPGALPAGISSALSAKLEQSGVWQELTQELPSLAPQEARGRILQLMADLPPETTAAEKGAIYQALQTLRSPAPEAERPSQATQAPQANQVAGEARPAADNPAFQPPVASGATPLPAQVKDAPQETPTPVPTQARASLQAGLSDLFAALFEQAPGEQGKALREAAAALPSKLQALTSALQGRQGAEAARLGPVLDISQALTTQVQMGNALGNLLYVPLPITLRETKQEAGLYVLKRNGGSRKVDEANVTVAICLETQNLGPVDTLLKVERNDIALQFRVDNPESRAFFQAQLSQAAGLSFPAPYRFQSASVVLREAPLTPLNAGQTLQRAFGLSAQGALDISI